MAVGRTRTELPLRDGGDGGGVGVRERDNGVGLRGGGRDGAGSATKVKTGGRQQEGGDCNARVV